MPRETSRLVTRDVMATTHHSLNAILRLACTSHSWTRSAPSLTTLPAKMKRGTASMMMRGEARKITRFTARLKRGHILPASTSRMIIGILKDCIEAWQPRAPRPMFTRPRLCISVCSSQCRRPGFKGTNFATASVLIDQETVIVVTNEAVISQCTALEGWKCRRPPARLAKGDHHSTPPGNVRYQEAGGHAPSVPSFAATEAEMEMTSMAGVPRACASRARAAECAYAKARTTCSQAEAAAHRSAPVARSVARASARSSSPAASASDSSRMRTPLPARKPATTV
mmetsp:Transcript_15756/g.47281  ORF Transcript_15756/g.47281 Transcript_15756/m.47281 type:complete len:284 (-) Transcript_15756:571-1422(-)